MISNHNSLNYYHYAFIFKDMALVARPRVGVYFTLGFTIYCHGDT